MAKNPYAGTNFEDAWHEGFVAGYLAPDDDHPAPTPLTVDQQTVYSEGVLAGQESVRSFSIPPVTDDHKDEPWEAIAHILAEVAELGHTALEIGKVGTLGASAIFSFVSIGVLLPKEVPFFEEAAAQAMSRVRQQLAEEGLLSDNTELFMAACNRTDHAHDPAQDDELTKQGWWHGKVFLRFEEALSEGKAHEHPDDTRVLRFQTAAPDIIDVLDLN